MEKNITNYPDYTRAVIKGLTEDGLILCDIYGSRNIKQLQEDGTEIDVDMPLFDENVSVENGKYFTLNEDELKTLNEEELKTFIYNN